MRDNPVFYIQYKAVIVREYNGELVERCFYGKNMQELQDGIDTILKLKNTKSVKYYRMIVVEEEVCQD